ncbi:MAG: flavin reductase family protein [Candidatus Neomarinimicrobiota bacterium]|uniref:Flavin reductase like domain-containing protein n=1 Tax=marine metagenome TaxID=408172 RepID=A0A381TNR2_9ZZZZ|nr:flavin reductase family protein [Candidatus Neomarinimicrobiota bacterium]|tara:strand:+ start:647 stop:1270 length:624 start_codon:yes stop_codon:yes gene_type:complete
MLFDPAEHSFHESHKLMIGSIIPRPIAFVSTVSKNGILNLAPFSYFNGVCSNPPTIMFAPGRRGYDGKIKDTLKNIQDTNEFVVNIVSEGFVDQMVVCATDFDPTVNEFDESGLTPGPSHRVKPPLVQESLISFECKLYQVVEVGDGSPGSGFVVMGTIVMFHIDDGVYENGRINLEKLNPVGRLAGNNYTKITNTFESIRKIKPDK